MHSIKAFTGRFVAAASSAVIAATAMGGNVLPSVSTMTVYAEGQAASESNSDVSLKMGLSAGGSKIGISFYLDVKGDISDYAVTLDGESVSPKDTTNGWLVTTDEFAMNMNKKHSVVVKKGSKEMLSKDVSVSDYLHTLLDSDKYSAYHSLVKTMLRYGGASQKYFGTDSGGTVDSDVEGAEISSVTVEEASFDKTAFNTKLSGKPVSYYGMNLSLRSETRFTLFFELNQDVDSADALDFLNGFTFGGKAVSAEMNGDSYVTVSIDVPANGLRKDYTFTNGTISADFSPLQYLSAASSDSDENLVNVCKALYAYGKTAETPIDEPADDPANDPEPKLEAKGTVHSGEGTYYDLADSNLGNAMLNDVRGEHYYAAMNTSDYNDAMLAGAYVEVTGPKGSVDVYIVDRLSEGAKGDIDLDPKAFEKIADKSDGRVQITWKIIPFDDAATKNMSFRFKDNDYNPYFSEIQIIDQKYPIYSLEFLKDSEYVEIPRTEYNYFKYENGLGESPYTFRITDIYGHVVIEENIDLSSGTLTSGTVQFPD